MAYRRGPLGSPTFKACFRAPASGAQIQAAECYSELFNKAKHNVGNALFAAKCYSELLNKAKHNVGNALFNETRLLHSSAPESHRRRPVPATLIEQPILNVTMIALAHQAGKAFEAFSDGCGVSMVDPH